MSDPVLPLGSASFDGLVEVREIGPQGMITLRGDLSAPEVIAAVTDLAGLEMPGLRGANTAGDTGLLWMSPDELLLLVPYRQAPAAVDRLTAALDGQHVLIVNVSDMRALFQLRGTQLRDVLAKLAPVDFAPEALPAGELRRTRFAQVAAGVWLLDDTTARVFCFRSVAGYMFSLLSTVADPDSQVGFHVK
ncbi:sarcosine oxidase subunit gamma [Antarctobacter heliothermus]|uniref:Sarcosine oxidase subunit gamma n=1 Tax=Antarctobacter heliothermus TaxID=74033 RepID=A0A239H537_9RHOB|nr:sarcosine oxidase subunit gamma family protein [Antarctobacter heliothermus]SNS76507.1 sarcosine oxidase subunit gamma [Antarctobacter heliothermus]